jgi:hypothetical protein
MNADEIMKLKKQLSQADEGTEILYRRKYPYAVDFKKLVSIEEDGSRYGIVGLLEGGYILTLDDPGVKLKYFVRTIPLSYV